MLRVGIVGVGRWGQCVAKKLSGMLVDDVPVQVVAHCRMGSDPIPNLGRLVSLSELVYGSDVDVVIATAPPVTTLLAAVGAMKAQKPVLVTKPFLAPADVVGLKSPLVVDFVRLWSPCWKMLKSAVAEKVVAGCKVASVDIRFGGQGRGMGPVRLFPSIFDYGPHVFAFLYDLFGTSAVWAPGKVRLDDVRDGRQVYTVDGNFGGASLSLVTGNGVDTGMKHVRVTMSDESFFCYMDDGKVCAHVGSVTGSTKPVHVEWNHDPLGIMLANFLLDARLGVIDERTLTYSRLGLAACNEIAKAGVAG